MFPCCSHGDLRTLSQIGIVSLKCTFRRRSFLCKAGNGGYRRNPDFSKQNNQGFSRHWNMQNEERDGSEILEESELFSSKNGPVPSASKSQATSTPGAREKKILEEFRKVQAQLRARAAAKGGKKADSSLTQAKDKKIVEESKNVDALIEILRNHTTQQGQSSGYKGSGRDLTTPDQLDQTGTFEEETSTSFLDSNNTVKEEVQEQEFPTRRPSSERRPSSNFRRRSPVPPVKYKPILGDSIRDTLVNGERKSIQPEADMHLESKLEMDLATEPEPSFADGYAYGALLDDESDDEEGNGEDDAEEQEPNINKDWNAMRLQELRAEAKSRGMKGYSKLKKVELMELLSGDST